MNTEEVKRRFEEAIMYLVNEKLIDGKNVAKDIATKTGVSPDKVREARRGVERSLTGKFIKNFCMVYGGTISYDWILEGKGSMINSSDRDNITVELPSNIATWDKDAIISLLYKMVDTYNRTLEDHERMRKMFEDITKRDQDNLKYLMSQIAKCV